MTGRQRPGTASGVLFLTLEDETGFINVIVWPRVLERFRAVVLGASLLYVKGCYSGRGKSFTSWPAPSSTKAPSWRTFPLKARDFH